MWQPRLCPWRNSIFVPSEMWAPPKKGLSCGQVFCLDKCWIQSRQSRERIRMKHSRDRIAAPLWGSTESWWVCLPQCCSWDIIKIKCVPPYPFLHPFLHLLKIWPHRQCACSMWNTPTPTGFQQAVNSFPHTHKSDVEYVDKISIFAPLCSVRETKRCSESRFL